MYIVKHIENVPAFLLGNNFLKRGLGLIAYTGCINDRRPEVIFYYPINIVCPVFYEPPQSLYTCTTKCTINPLETQVVEFLLPSASPVLRTDNILITAQGWDDVAIIPSKSELESQTELQCYKAAGLVANLTNKLIKTRIKGKCELINKFQAIYLEREFKPQLQKAITQHPLGRDILPSNNKWENIQVSTVSVNYINHTVWAVSVSNLELADTVRDKEPTYEGEAEIKQEIIEPQGLDLPTLIYKNAGEAINLNNLILN